MTSPGTKYLSFAPVYPQPNARAPLWILNNNIDTDQWGEADDASKIAASEKTRSVHAPVVNQAVANFKSGRSYSDGVSLSMRVASSSSRLLRSRSHKGIDRALFRLIVARFAWCAFWFGSDDLIAWGINALFFPAVVYFASGDRLVVHGRKRGHEMVLDLPTD
jgi:hypothetical protein